MIKGFLRLWIVLSIFAWGGATAFILNKSGNYLDLFVNPHLHPAHGFSMPLQTRWCVLVATPTFLAKSASERTQLASDFFPEHIEAIARESYVNVEEFRKRFIASATLTLEEAPIETWVDSDQTQYREISYHAWHGGIQISKIAFAWDTLLVSIIAAFVIALVVTVLFVVLRWVKRGFVS